MTNLYHEYNGVKFGWDGTSDPYPLISGQGVDNLRHSGGIITASGTDGGAPTPLDISAASWLTTVEVTGGDLDAFMTRSDALKAATVKPPGVTELAYDVVIDDVVRTRFARCTDRQIPHDEPALVRFYAVAQLEFTATDPMVYGPEQNYTLDIDETYAWTSAGWAPAWRWEAIIAGPVTNPSVSASGLGSSAHIRYVGTIADNYNLVLHNTPRQRWAKVVTDADLANVAEPTIGENAYGSLDGGPFGAGRPPGWFPIATDSVSVSFDATAGSGTCDFTWREGMP